MSDMESNGQRLDTWQEIATHLGVSVRTCQKWEKEQALPVHRLKGDRARVWAYAEELDCWKSSFEARKDATSNAPDCLIPVAIEPPPERSSRRRWLIGGAAGILGAGWAGFALGRSWHSAVRPVGCDIEGPLLTVFGPGHVPLWGHVFPEAIDKFLLPNDRMQYLFEDLDGDGDLETLYAYQSKSNLYSVLVCFNSRGKVLWEFLVGRTVTDTAGRQFTPPYMIQCFDRYVLPGGASRIVVVSVHSWSFACQVAILDSNGKLISDYWHRGHLKNLAIADIDRDGSPEILLGGVNDAPDYKQATLVIFDGRQVSGGCRDSAGQPYFLGLPSGTEKTRIFFPRTPGSIGREFNMVNSLRVNDQRIVVAVLEAYGSTDPYWALYELDHQLRPATVLLSFELKQLYTKLQSEGKLPHESPDEIEQHLKRDIQVIAKG